LDENGVLTVVELHTEKLCLGDVCLDESGLQQMTKEEEPVVIDEPSLSGDESFTVIEAEPITEPEGSSSAPTELGSEVTDQTLPATTTENPPSETATTTQ